MTGNTAGSLAQITGSLGRTLALLSFDKDYKKVRNRYKWHNVNIK